MIPWLVMPSYIVNQAGITVTVVASDKVRQLLEQAGECPTLKYVICIDCSLPEDVTTLVKEKNIELALLWLLNIYDNNYQCYL